MNINKFYLLKKNLKIAFYLICHHFVADALLKKKNEKVYFYQISEHFCFWPVNSPIGERVNFLFTVYNTKLTESYQAHLDTFKNKGTTTITLLDVKDNLLETESVIGNQRPLNQLELRIMQEDCKISSYKEVIEKTMLLTIQALRRKRDLMRETCRYTVREFDPVLLQGWENWD